MPEDKTQKDVYRGEAFQQQINQALQTGYLSAFPATNVNLFLREVLERRVAASSGAEQAFHQGRLACIDTSVSEPTTPAKKGKKGKVDRCLK